MVPGKWKGMLWKQVSVKYFQPLLFLAEETQSLPEWSLSEKWIRGTHSPSPWGKRARSLCCWPPGRGGQTAPTQEASWRNDLDASTASKGPLRLNAWLLRRNTDVQWDMPPGAGTQEEVTAPLPGTKQGARSRRGERCVLGKEGQRRDLPWWNGAGIQSQNVRRAWLYINPKLQVGHTTGCQSQAALEIWVRLFFLLSFKEAGPRAGVADHYHRLGDAELGLHQGLLAPHLGSSQHPLFPEEPCLWTHTEKEVWEDKSEKFFPQYCK